jgi:catechol 2,3-dioxygenase-like lactoylglutathione lyase family enzyme
MLAVFRIYMKHVAVLLAAGFLCQLAAEEKPKRPRITAIDHVRLYVTDIDKSRDFYTKFLGIPDRGSACLVASRPCFTVNWAEQQAIELEQAPSSGVKNSLAEIAFATDDVTQMRRYLMARGVTCGRIVKEKDTIWHFELSDPEGNLIAFVERRFPRPFDDYLPFFSIRPVSTYLLHAGFVVKDAAAENRFYVDLLGFKLYWYGGMKDDGVDWYELQVPDGDNWIEYMLNIPADANHKQLGAQNHFSFGVNEIQAAAEQLRKNGVEKIAGPGIGRDGKRGLNVYDPDDTRVEVTEFTPAQKPCCHAYTAPHPTP